MRRILAVLAVLFTGATAQAAPLPTGVQSPEPVNFPGRYVRHRDQLARLDPVTASSAAQDKLDASFTVDPAWRRAAEAARPRHQGHRPPLGGPRPRL
ncbi:MAG: AbfB domain-containing protein [Actinoplanes sp.]